MTLTKRPLDRLIDASLEASVVGSFTSLGYSVRSRMEHWTSPSHVSGRVVVVTGATSGLGLAMAQRLSLLGGDVHLVGRNPDRLDAALRSVSRVATNDVTGHLCDLSSLHETDKLAQELSSLRIDVLVHNAGALLRTYTPTSEHVETTLAVHLLSPYWLTEQLIGYGAFAPWARIISMTSGGMYTERFDLTTLEMGPSDYKGSTAYARAKRAQTILNAYWQEHYGPRGLAFHLVHPGWAATPGVSTGIPGFAKVMGPFLRSPDQGADTAVWLAGAPPGEPQPGLLWHDRHSRPLYRLRRTRLSGDENDRAITTLPVWLAHRVARALDSTSH